MFHLFRDAVLLARRQSGLYFAALLDQQTILDAFGSASSLSSLARLVHARGRGLHGPARLPRNAYCREPSRSL